MTAVWKYKFYNFVTHLPYLFVYVAHFFYPKFERNDGVCVIYTVDSEKYVDEILTAFQPDKLVEKV